MSKIMKVPIIKTNDPKIIINSIAWTNCNKMHKIADLMYEVRKMQKAPEFGNNSQFCSVKSPECLDEILDKLIYMFNCEANCGLSAIIDAISNNPTEQTVIDYDKLADQLIK